MQLIKSNQPHPRASFSGQCIQSWPLTYRLLSVLRLSSDSCSFCPFCQSHSPPVCGPTCCTWERLWGYGDWTSSLMWESSAPVSLMLTLLKHTSFNKYSLGTFPFIQLYSSLDFTTKICFYTGRMELIFTQIYILECVEFVHFYPVRAF